MSVIYNPWPSCDCSKRFDCIPTSFRRRSHNFVVCDRILLFFVTKYVFRLSNIIILNFSQMSHQSFLEDRLVYRPHILVNEINGFFMPPGFLFSSESFLKPKRVKKRLGEMVFQMNSFNMEARG